MFHCKLGDLATIKSGKSNRQDATEDGPYCFFDRSMTAKRSNRYLFDCKAIIVPGEGKDFFPRYFEGKFDLHQRCYFLSSLDESVASTKYLYYYLTYNHSYFARVAVGSTVPSLRLNSFEDMPVNLHSPAEQQHIVGVIGSVDDLIEQKFDETASLLSLGDWIYKQYTAGHTPYGFLGDVVNIETGSMNLDENDPNGPYPFYTRNIGSFFADKYTHDCTGVIVAGEGNFSPKYVSGKFGLHQRAYLITPKSSKTTPEIIYEIILSNVSFLNTVAVGSTVKSLRRFCFEQMPYCPDADYSSLADKLKPIFNKVLEDRKTISVLSSLKKSLLSKYF